MAEILANSSNYGTPKIGLFEIKKIISAMISDFHKKRCSQAAPLLLKQKFIKL